ncbi:MAG TPA: trypsin-like peptidase domain-containing protein [Vicinamibacterales bacterium]|nr:trypsin-like peptidase domain-containing protein [Vicinamibacterales bacterium]
MEGVLPKLFYSALLIGLSAVLMRELWSVWFDPQIYIGRFDVVSEAGDDAEAGQAFAKRIVGAQAIIARQLLDYQTRRAADAPTDATYLLPGTAPLLLPPNALAGVDITVQNVNLSQILSVVRKTLLAPNEIRGNVTSREGSVLTAVDWPRAPARADSQPPLTYFLTPSRSTLQEAAAYVACSVSWARAASEEATVASFSRAQFCDFAAALGDLYALGAKASRAGGLSADEAGVVRARAAELRSHYGSDGIFAEIYRLRADLLDLLPEGVRTQGELVDAQEDRLRYAMLSPKLQQLPEEERRLTALALARPAILLPPKQPLKAPDNWAGLLVRNEAAIRATEASTGLVIGSDGTPIGSGFIAGPGLMITARFVLDVARSGGQPKSQSALRLCLGASQESCDSMLTIGDVVYRSDESAIAVARLSGHDPVLHPALAVSGSLPDANTLTGRYAFVIGYPFEDQRLPKRFIDLLLGKVAGHKRIMPGRILAFGEPGASLGAGPAAKAQRVFTTDISTSGGTGGGPLVDLTTGAVLGMSYAGMWQGERGKFAYAEAFPDAVLQVIGRTSSGQSDAQGNGR